MLRTLQGIFENGSIELGEDPPNVRRARVLVTFLPELTSREVDSIRASGETWGRQLELIRRLREEPSDAEDVDDFEEFQRDNPIRFRAVETKDTEVDGQDS